MNKFSLLESVSAAQPIQRNLPFKAAPGYLLDSCIETHSSASGWRRQSTDKRDLRVRRMITRLGDRAFSAAGPSYWNSLPSTLCALIQSTPLRLDQRPICSARPTPL